MAKHHAPKILVSWGFNDMLLTSDCQLLSYTDFHNCTVVLHGPGLLSVHCVLENIAGTVTLFPQDGALCLVNGSVVTDPCQLTQGKQFCNI